MLLEGPRMDLSTGAKQTHDRDENAAKKHTRRRACGEANRLPRRVGRTVKTVLVEPV